MVSLIAVTMLLAQNARQTFENDQVVINERHAKPHDHKLNRVMIYAFRPAGNCSIAWTAHA